MPIDPTKDVIIIGREDDQPRGRIIPPVVGFIKCGGCGCRCLITRASRKLVDEQGVQPCCRLCLPKTVGETHIMGVTDEQLMERFEMDMDANDQ